VCSNWDREDRTQKYELAKKNGNYFAVYLSVIYMRMFEIPIKKVEYLLYRWSSVFVDPMKLLKSPKNLICYLKDILAYSKMPGAEKIQLMDTYPCVCDSSSFTSFDHHYFYQDIWAFKKIFQSGADNHIDIGSRIDLVGFLSTITDVIFLDIRALDAQLEQFHSIKGTILALPFKSNSVKSISCLHVAEHIGLGRYGDSLDPSGTIKAANELSRVLAPEGILYFSLPIGKPKICFNAHRVHSVKQIRSYFSELELIELSAIDDQGNFIKISNEDEMDNYDYGCGLFVFSKK
jgi:hypothetical protein